MFDYTISLYLHQKQPGAPSEDNLSSRSAGASEHWKYGQDDSVLYRKHLLPLSRKQSRDEATFIDCDRRRSEFPTIVLTGVPDPETPGRPTSLFCHRQVETGYVVGIPYDGLPQKNPTAQVQWEKETELQDIQSRNPP